MRLELLAFIAPVLGVLFFYGVEKLCKQPSNNVFNRLKTIATLEAFNLVFSFALSVTVLILWVFWLAPLQIFSFSTINAPKWLVFILSFLFLDFISYIQHVAHHKIPWLWRLHRLHHSDQHVDSFTALLHHPLEIFSGFLISVTFAVIFDIPVIVLTMHALLVGLHAPFTHLRTLVSDEVNKYLMFIVVTPNVHRVHHSLDTKEGNANFGGIFVFWDYLFGTICIKSENNLHKSVLGIDAQQSPATINFASYIKNPFRK